jgi:N-acetylglucosaminyldiphosphoundecaprenol N-acetyl-beta-D-mannosaminyltransferase
MELLGVEVAEVSFREALERIGLAYRRQVGRLSVKKRPYFVVTPNPEQVMIAQRDEEFRRVLNSADLAIADGVGLVLASRLLRRSKDSEGLPERVSGMELMEELIRKIAKMGGRVMLVGGKGEVATKAADKLKTENGELRIVGVEGVKDIREPGKEEEKELMRQIKEFRSDLLLVGFGAPWQEKWVARNLSRLKTKVVMVVGGAFDQIVHPSLRPPKLWEKVGLGWFYRLVRQPWRIKRQLRLIGFGGLVLRQRLRRS